MRRKCTIQRTFSQDCCKNHHRMTYHECVNEAIEHDEQPDGTAHVSNASPHAEHGSKVVKGLQCCRSLAFCQNDNCVDYLVELAQVEKPAPEGQSFVPDSANICRVRKESVRS